MAKTGSVSFHKIGVAVAVGGLIILLLSFLDYMQDGKSDSALLGALITVVGSLMYMGGRNSKAQDD